MSNMPPEWAPHSATWMGYPSAAYDGCGVSTEEAQQAWANVANAISDHERLFMLCHPTQKTSAKKRLSSAIELVDYSLNDAWLRDTGPTFIIESNRLVGIDWRFNGWGNNTQLEWQQDAGIARFICEYLDCEARSSTLTNEGGGLHVSGQDQVLLTKTVQLDPGRNPDWSQSDVESEIHALLGTERAIWLERGLYRDYEENGTRGHVDIVACFTPNDDVLFHEQTQEQHPDHINCRELRAQLADAGLNVVPIAAPKVLRDNYNWVDYSYLNHYVCNGAVIVPTFADPNDGPALERLAEVYPDRAIRGIDARVIFAMGGGVHCITQQQPLV